MVEIFEEPPLEIIPDQDTEQVPLNDRDCAIIQMIIRQYYSRAILLVCVALGFAMLLAIVMPQADSHRLFYIWSGGIFAAAVFVGLFWLGVRTHRRELRDGYKYRRVMRYLGLVRVRKEFNQEPNNPELDGGKYWERRSYWLGFGFGFSKRDGTTEVIVNRMLSTPRFLKDQVDESGIVMGDWVAVNQTPSSLVLSVEKTEAPPWGR